MSPSGLGLTTPKLPQLTGELPQHSAAAALRDSVVWEPSFSTCQEPSSSTPNNGTPWSEVVVRSRKKAPGRTPCRVSSSVCTPLSNKYSALSMSVEPLVQGPADSKFSPKDAAPPLIDVILPSTHGCLCPTGSMSSTGPSSTVPLASVPLPLKPVEATPEGRGAIAHWTSSLPGA
ncbi:Hypothetical predicted protein [Xyrichtys novacula]|uniref:Uncharacterized protein n=1 Tax=Xyrichtys novacula TaxID=13765 RepID=A0AAV1FKN0_XYRNO|nr:Hypothetical predicted protein [Xyrichtys novacula]